MPPTRDPQPPPSHGIECPDYLEMSTLDIKDVEFSTGKDKVVMTCDVSINVLTDDHLVPYEAVQAFVGDLRNMPAIDPQAVGTVMLQEVVHLMNCRAATCSVTIHLSASVKLVTIHSWEHPPSQETKECLADS